MPYSASAHLQEGDNPFFPHFFGIKYFNLDIIFKFFIKFLFCIKIGLKKYTSKVELFEKK